MTRVLGIDPALTKLGWGVIELNAPKIHYINSGVIVTKSSEPIHLRLAHLTAEIQKIIDRYRPDLVAMEETFVNINAISSLKLAYVRGALMAIIGTSGLPYFEFLPNKIKKTLVGVGHAEKNQVKHMVKTIISHIPPEICYDQSDALAVAYTGSIYGFKAKTSI